MQSRKTIVAIAGDDALLRSLAFALGVEGYRVEPYKTWQSALEMMEACLCVIVDVDICRDDIEAKRSLLDPRSRIVLLSDGLPPSDVSASACIVMKPLEGSDILAGVDHFCRPPT